MKDICIAAMTPATLPAAAGLALALWPDNELVSLEEEFTELMNDPSAALLLALAGQEAVGFAHCQLRRDYVEGTDSSPVGYLEGIYVLPAWRGRGIAAKLLRRCEDWARQQGCREFASDCELHNIDSLAFHLRLGFEEANRIICFRKAL